MILLSGDESSAASLDSFQGHSILNTKIFLPWDLISSVQSLSRVRLFATP